MEQRAASSRQRFGAWGYKVGLMDHSVAQGIEWANQLILEEVEEELTYLGTKGC